MERFPHKKAYIGLFLVVLLFGLVSWLSLTSIRQLSGNARVVNYVGIVRGASQKLIKRELMGYRDDTLIARLDSIVAELTEGGGENRLIVIDDEVFMGNMSEVRHRWREIKEEIERVRAGEDSMRLFMLSEDYFDLVDRTVSSAEAFSEARVRKSIYWLIGADVVFVLLLLCGVAWYLYSLVISRRAEILKRIAYVDTLTQMPNRASCEKEIRALYEHPPSGDVAVLIFDMNGLKHVNDLLGHRGGDRVIAAFGKILSEGAGAFGFLGRYGGDEFLGIFCDANEEMVGHFLRGVNDRVMAYNLLCITPFEKISFAVGYCIKNLSQSNLEEMIHEADRLMYVRKREMRESL